MSWPSIVKNTIMAVGITGGIGIVWWTAEKLLGRSIGGGGKTFVSSNRTMRGRALDGTPHHPPYQGKAHSKAWLDDVPDPIDDIRKAGL